MTAIEQGPMVVFWTAGGWMVLDEGFRVAFGTDTIATAFTAAASEAMVLGSLRRLNPGREVEVAS